MTWKFEESSNYSTFISKHYTYDNPGNYTVRIGS